MNDIVIHTVTAIYGMDNIFDPKIRVNSTKPIYYQCMSCFFKGNLEEGVKHVVDNQFTVREEVE